MIMNRNLLRKFNVNGFLLSNISSKNCSCGTQIFISSVEFKAPLQYKKWPEYDCYGVN